jgi:hypothetical protein
MDKDEKQLNQNNEWLRFLETGEGNEPYLKKKINSRPKPIHYSIKQRRIYQGK